MNSFKSSVINHVLGQQKGMGLESFFYGCEELYPIEIDAIFKRHWILIGHASELTPNSYVGINIGNESILLSMDANGVVHAYFNLCRHRGCTLAPPELTVSKKIICPYHSWQYGLDGSLLFARGMPSSFDCSLYGLKPCAIKNFQG